MSRKVTAEQVGRANLLILHEWADERLTREQLNDLQEMVDHAGASVDPRKVARFLALYETERVFWPTYGES